MQKKLLILGGKPIGSCEIVEYAKSKGIYTVVADYLPKEQSAAKRIADECWEISTADLCALKSAIKEEGITGIYTGVHEFNIEKMIELCEDINYPCFCTLEQWRTLNNKKAFKELCRHFDVPVTKEFSLEHFTGEDIDKYPVIVKPVDGSGSRGFSICSNQSELKKAYNQALNFSDSKKVLIEKYMNYKNSVIINYTLVNGKIYFNGISDKQSKKVFKNGAPIMAVQFYSSVYEKEYLEKLNEKVKKMFLDYGLRNGVIWIEAFCDKGEFTFNEMGFRFGGSLTYLPVQHLYGVDQLGLQIEYALEGKYKENYILTEERRKEAEKYYCILPIHVRTGKIKSIAGIDELRQKRFVLKIVPVHFVEDQIENWGSAQQVFAYIHIVGNSKEDIEKYIDEILSVISVKDYNGEEMLFNLYKEKIHK